MESLEMSFNGSPEKYGKAAYCDLVYTQSKLYDNILFRDLLSFKELWSQKSQVITLQALYSHLRDFFKVRMQEKDCLISTHEEQIRFLRQQNHKITEKNLQRTKSLLKSHQIAIRELIVQKQQQLLVIQSQKQLLQQRVEELQNEVEKNASMVNCIEQERQQMQKKQQRYEQSKTRQETLIKDLQQRVDALQKEQRQLTGQLNDEKLQLQLTLKKELIQKQQQHKRELQDLHLSYKNQIQAIEKQRLKDSLEVKQKLNKTIDHYEELIKELKIKNCQLSELNQTLSKQAQFEKQRNDSLTVDIAKQDEILDKYEQYLKKADDNLIDLKQQLIECQSELQSARHQLQKSLIERGSLLNRMAICQQQALKWRQSYYLSKSISTDIVEN